MARYVLLVPSSPKPGRDDDYNRWYDEIHVPDLLAIPGITGASRYIADPSSPNPSETGYLTIYDVETDDPEAVFAELMRRASAGDIKVSDALDTSTAKLTMYRAA